MEAPLVRVCRPLSRRYQVLARKPRCQLASFSTTITRAQEVESGKGNPVLHRRTPSKFAQSLNALDTGRSHEAASNQGGTAPTDEDLEQVRRTVNVVLQHKSIPSEKESLTALTALEAVARKVSGVQQSKPSRQSEDSSPASAILSLDSRPPTAASSTISATTIDMISDFAFNIISQPTVDITPAILRQYVLIQSLLLRPDSLPEVFELYRTKPIPSLTSTKTVTYSDPKPDAIATAVPTATANLALTSALQKHSLDLALSIIETTFRANSFSRSKIFRQALPPIGGAALAPFALFTLASSIAPYQNMLPTENFTAMAFAGMLTYTTAIGTIGYVALTTANDQMQRVTWATGMPLWERWVREEERAAVDRVAISFGFREKWRWGEEEGGEWERLREWIGQRGMVLDQVGLMEGME